MKFRHLRKKDQIYGYYVAVCDKLQTKHSRLGKRILKGNISALTIAKIAVKDKKGEAIITGLAFCSNKDNFSKQKGRKISTERAISLTKYSFRETIE